MATMPQAIAASTIRKHSQGSVGGLGVRAGGLHLPARMMAEREHAEGEQGWQSHAGQQPDDDDLPQCGQVDPGVHG
jgi:hypothetical protein